MKKILLFIFIGMNFISSESWAQNPVPNPGFENWTQGNPDSWWTNNMGPGASPVLQSSIVNAGLSAARGEVIAIGPISFFPLLASEDASANGFPVSQQYTAMTFYYQMFVQGTTTFNAFVEFNDVVDDPVGGGAMIFNSNVNTFTQATVPIFYNGSNPYECIIGFVLDDTAGVPSVGNYFIVDDVELTNAVGIDDNSLLTTSIEKLYPNPAQQFTTVYFSLDEPGDVTFDLYDVTGRKFPGLFLKNEIAGRHKVDLQLSRIPAGLYVLEMVTQNTKSELRIVVTGN